MTGRATLLALVCGLAACSEPAERLEGTWAIDIGRTLQLPGFVEIPEPQRAVAQRTAERLLQTVRITFDRDGALVWAAAGHPRPGRFEVKQRAGRRWVLSVRFRDAETPETMVAEWRTDGLVLEVGEDRWALRSADDGSSSEQ